MRLSWRPQAEQDRYDAIDHIAHDDPLVAIEQLDRIEEQTEVLLQQPKLGRPGRVKDTRELVISRTPFIAVYHLPDAQHIEILRLMHSAQQWPPRSPAAKERTINPTPSATKRGRKT